MDARDGKETREALKARMKKFCRASKICWVNKKKLILGSLKLKPLAIKTRERMFGMLFSK